MLYLYQTDDARPWRIESKRVTERDDEQEDETIAQSSAARIQSSDGLKYKAAHIEEPGLVICRSTEILTSTRPSTVGACAAAEVRADALRRVADRII